MKARELVALEPGHGDWGSLEVLRIKDEQGRALLGLQMNDSEQPTVVFR